MYEDWVDGGKCDKLDHYLCGRCYDRHLPCDECKALLCKIKKYEIITRNYTVTTILLTVTLWYAIISADIDRKRTRVNIRTGVRTAVRVKNIRAKQVTEPPLRIRYLSLALAVAGACLCQVSLWQPV